MGDPESSSRAAADAKEDVRGGGRAVARRSKRKQYKEVHQKRMEELRVKVGPDGKRTPRTAYIITKEAANNTSKRRRAEDNIERFYANNGFDFNPRIEYLPPAMSSYGKDYELNARGIYYRHNFSKDQILCNRKVWTPLLPDSLDDAEDLSGWRLRASSFAFCSRENESWLRKSEYPWEADAWANVFQRMRFDGNLAMDKRVYHTYCPEIDPHTRTLTRKSSFVKCIPDMTFGLRTFTHEHLKCAEWNFALHGSRLERLLLHPNYGLVSDPCRSDIDLAFPFMVYEAKGEGGDCREARRQACSAAAFYLDMLDQLAREPGRWDLQRVYQTASSHEYQVFVLTSFGAYWHLLVGHRRPRLPEEHAGVSGMSENVYIFQRLWSGHVISKEKAELLVYLIDQIHTWAVDMHRKFVTDHLRTWHEKCDEEYLINRNVGQYGNERREWTHRPDVCPWELKVPMWVKFMDDASREQFERRALTSLSIADDVRCLLKGKEPVKPQPRIGYRSVGQYHCPFQGCMARQHSLIERIEHLQKVHGTKERGLEKARFNRQPKRIAAVSGSQASHVLSALSRHQEDTLIAEKELRLIGLEVAEDDLGNETNPFLIE